MRVAEPHHDGTPHWHLLLFIPTEQAEQATAIFERYALQEDGDEPGAAERRFTTEVIDSTKGSATGYIAKYISKNIDGRGIDADLYGLDAKQSAQRIEAWASLRSGESDSFSKLEVRASQSGGSCAAWTRKLSKRSY